MKDLVASSAKEIRFLPRASQFWLYHLTGIAVFLSLQIGVGLVLDDKTRLVVFEMLAFSIWVIGFTLSALTLRFKYAQWNELGLSVPKLVPHLLGLVMLLAFATFVLMAVIALPPYWDHLMAAELVSNPNQTNREFLIELTIGNWFSSAVILFCWVFIYIGIIKTREVKTSQLANLKLQNSLKEAQLSSLSNQLNPHFLFNSLNNIRFVIHENADQADKMITSLSQVLRYSLESSQQQKLPLHKELEIIQRYVDIVSLQFESRFRFAMDVDDGLHDFLVPPMLLQMLIENAVKHGVEQMEKGSTVAVTAKEERNRLVIKVTNDAPVRSSSAVEGAGIGLENIEQRLDILYGDAADIDASLTGGQFNVVVRFPVEHSV